MKKTLIRLAILALTLGVWEVYGKPAYATALAMRGTPYGLAEASLGYFAVLLVGYILAWWVSRRLE